MADEHRKGSERHPVGDGRGLGLAWRVAAAVIGCALAVAAPTSMSLPSMADPPPAAPQSAVAGGDRPASVAAPRADDASVAALGQVFAVLARAESAATESGRTTTPEIQQAAGELGMLLSSYLAAHPDVAARARAAQTVAVDPVLPAGVVVPPPVLTPLPVSPATPEPTPTSTAGPSALATEPAAALPDPTPSPARSAAPAAGPTAGLGLVDPPENDEVTFADVWAATLRLAALLDPTASAGTAVPATDGSTPLTASLREVVARWGDSTKGYLNGYIPADVLCGLTFAPGQLLRCDAAIQLDALDAAYHQQFGTDLPVTDSYRSYDEQVQVKAAKGWLAATPGYSNHGWGLAVDLGSPIGAGASAQYLWLRLHGPDYGWDNPSWARLDGSKPEPWHFEFFAAGPMPNRALSAADVQLWKAAAAGSAPTTPAPIPSPTPSPTVDATIPPTPTPTPTASEPPTPSPSPTASEPTTPSPSPSDLPSPTASDPAPTPSSSEPAPTPTDPVPTPTAPAHVTVPDVTGSTPDEALTTLLALGFVHVTAFDQPVPSDTVGAGLVVTTTPAAGTSESVDSELVLVLSSGPGPTPDPTPSPTGDGALAPTSTAISTPRPATRLRSGRA